MTWTVWTRTRKGEPVRPIQFAKPEWASSAGPKATISEAIKSCDLEQATGRAVCVVNDETGKIDYIPNFLGRDPRWVRYEPEPEVRALLADLGIYQ